MRNFRPHPRIKYGAGSNPLPRERGPLAGVSFDKLRTNEASVYVPLPALRELRGVSSPSPQPSPVKGEGAVVLERW